jgi:hypothetical protein
VGWKRERAVKHRRNILRGIWSYTDAYSYPNPNAYSDPMHGEMYANAKTAPNSRTAPLAQAFHSRPKGSTSEFRSTPRLALRDPFL